ncbi:hypothetical protein N9A45_01555 [bacterium]|nr:hypothetical protein [bacterium]
MLTLLVVDRNVSPFLGLYDFIQMRKTCKTLHDDDEAWILRGKNLPIANCNPRHKIGLHYLLQWSLRLTEIPGSVQWYQQLVNWLEYKVSIRIIFQFICSQNATFLKNMDVSEMSTKQRWQWEHLSRRNRALFKSNALEYDGRPAKRYRRDIPFGRIAQPCYG